MERVKSLVILVLGLVALCISFIELKSIWTFKKDLVEIKGKPAYANTYVRTVKDARGRQSQYSELYFTLENNDQVFTVGRNIDIAYTDPEYLDIMSSIKHADTVSVFVRKSEINAESPEVFEIRADGNICLDYNEHIADKKPVAIFSLLLGIALIAAFYFLNRLGKSVKKRDFQGEKILHINP